VQQALLQPGQEQEQPLLVQVLKKMNQPQ